MRRKLSTRLLALYSYYSKRTFQRCEGVINNFYSLNFNSFIIMENKKEVEEDKKGNAQKGFLCLFFIVKIFVKNLVKMSFLKQYILFNILDSKYLPFYILDLDISGSSQSSSAEHDSSSSSHEQAEGEETENENFLVSLMHKIHLLDSVTDKQSKKKILNEATIDGVVEYIKSKNITKIVTMAGAGISTCK